MFLWDSIKTYMMKMNSIGRFERQNGDLYFTMYQNLHGVDEF